MVAVVVVAELLVQVLEIDAGWFKVFSLNADILLATKMGVGIKPVKRTSPHRDRSRSSHSIKRLTRETMP